jgi:hypothetical protein
MNRRQNDRKGGVWKLDDILGHSYKWKMFPQHKKKKSILLH